MRWIKHLTSAHMDENVAALISEDGLEAYGFYWLLCEIIGSSMDKSDRCELTYPLPHWSRLLYCHHNKVGKYLGKLEVRGMCEVSKEGGSVRVRIPKLLKYRDEYSKKSGQPTEKVQTDSGAKIEIEIERENTDREKEKKRTRSARELVEGFELTDDLREWADEKCPSVDVDSETAHWLDRMKGNGYRTNAGPVKDAVATWRTHMRNAQKWTKGPVVPDKPSGRFAEYE